MLPGVLDRAFSAVFRNFSTLFLVAIIVVGPLHVGHALIFKRVIAVAELHPEIETFDKQRQVKSVGAAQLGNYRKAFGAVLLLELLLLPLMAGAARRTLKDEEEDKVPTATRSWKAAAAEAPRVFGFVLPRLPLLLVGAVAALVIGFLTLKTGLLLADFVPNNAAFVAVGVANTLAHSLALPLLFGVWAATSLGAPVKEKERSLDLY